MPEEETVAVILTALLAIAKARALEEKTLKSKFLDFRPLQGMKRLSEIPLCLAVVELTLK
jgi:hypothetical protein